MIPFCKDSGLVWHRIAHWQQVGWFGTGQQRLPVARRTEVAKSKYDTLRSRGSLDCRAGRSAGGKTRQIACPGGPDLVVAKGIDSPIVGVTKEKYLDDFVGAFDLELSAEDPSR